MLTRAVPSRGRVLKFLPGQKAFWINDDMNESSTSGFTSTIDSSFEDKLMINLMPVGIYITFALLVLFLCSIIHTIRKRRQIKNQLNNVTFSILDIPGTVAVNTGYASLKRTVRYLQSRNPSYESLMISVDKPVSEDERNYVLSDYLPMTLQREGWGNHSGQSQRSILSGIFINRCGARKQNNTCDATTLDRCVVSTRVSADSANNYDDITDYLSMNPIVTETISFEFERTDHDKGNIEGADVSQHIYDNISDRIDDVTLRLCSQTKPEVDTSPEPEMRESAMSTLLRSSWLNHMTSMVPGEDTQDFRFTAMSLMSDAGGVFIPEEDISQDGDSFPHTRETSNFSEQNESVLSHAHQFSPEFQSSDLSNSPHSLNLQYWSSNASRGNATTQESQRRTLPSSFGDAEHEHQQLRTFGKIRCPTEHYNSLGGHMKVKAVPSSPAGFEGRFQRSPTRTSGKRIFTSPQEPVVIQVAKQLQQTLVIRMPGQMLARRRDCRTLPPRDHGRDG